MQRTIALSLIVWLSLSVAVRGQTETASERPRDEVVSVPKEAERFSGMLIGKLVRRDIERGEFVITVDYVARVWENNKAPNPRALVGKTIVIEGVTGKFLDDLLLLRPGETMECEAQHRGGDRLRFPGEWLKKVPPFDPKNYPSPPAGFRAFAGEVAGKIESKLDESGEFVLRVREIVKTDSASKAEKPESVVGKPILVAGFWGKKRKPFDELKTGDTVRVGLLHRVPQSDHFGVTDVIQKMDEKKEIPDSNPKSNQETE